jgi:histidinol-phosphate/aromatic aminotransferase/cobyric acid decarboxylase-like protein
MSDVTAFFNPSFEKLAPIDKMDNRNVLNLSSNEAHHPRFTSLFEEFIREYDVSLVTKYPVFREAHNLASDYHGIAIDQLMLAPGSDFAINLLTNAIGKNTEGLITHSPNYTGYLHYAALQNMSIRCMETIDLEFYQSTSVTWLLLLIRKDFWVLLSLLTGWWRLLRFVKNKSIFYF